MPPVKRLLVWLLVAFLLYAVLTSPEAAARIFSSAWEVVTDGLGNIGRFFDRLIGG
jgi:hypothetical protein